MHSTTAMDYKQFYNLEQYLFETVTGRFREQKYISDFDFFCIVIWKANRAKSKIARKINSLPGRSLNERVRNMTNAIYKKHEAKDRLRFLINDMKFRLPMASAILTVFYPEEFTVYDERVCNQLPGKEKHLRLVNKSSFEKVWEGYEAFKKEVMIEATHESDLREKDRYLWGKSFHDQLRMDIENGFETEKKM
jgi:hypothetical protein